MGYTKEKAPKAYSLRISDNALQNIDDITGYMSWLIIYKVKATQIVILGIIHSNRRPSRIRKLRKIK